MTYSVKEIFYTLQGEGAHAGRPAVFCRFAGCNLWTGFEKDRSSAVCQFCDTDFIGVNGPGGGKFASPEQLAQAIESAWTERAISHDSGVEGKVSVSDNCLESKEPRYVVCTGGEPLLQLDEQLVDALHKVGFEIAIETNGTKQPPKGIDWICVSPKAGADFLLRTGDELKVVFPQAGLDLAELSATRFSHHFLQPMDGPSAAKNTQEAVKYCLENPRWKLSLQTHKMLGIS